MNVPNRFQVNAHRVFYDYIAARDGAYCLIGRIAHEKCRGELQIDHADSNPRNWNYDNLHLLCQKHNLEMRNKTSEEHLRIIRAYSARNVSESVRERGIESTHTLKAMVDYSQGSVEMQANSICERVFIDWVLTEIKRLGQLVKKEVVNSGAAVAGCSPVTASRYLDKLTCSVGPLQETRDQKGTLIVTFKKTKNGR